MSKKKFNQFLEHEGTFTPTADTKATLKIDPGVYELGQNMNGNTLFIQKVVNMDSYVSLPDSVTESVMSEVSKFWSPETKALYREFGITYKRGVLMYGPPGTGKTSTVMQVVARVVSEGGIAVYNPSPRLFSQAIQALREVQGDCKVVCVFEEFDKYCQTADFLSLLDGELQVDNVLFLATTNHIKNIPDSLTKRPSRFAKVVEVREPSYEARHVYIRTKMPTLSSEEVTNWTEMTEGFVIDQIKEVVLSVGCYGKSLKEAMKDTKEIGSSGFIGIRPNDDDDDEDE